LAVKYKEGFTVVKLEIEWCWCVC